jgi:hypothetical protein
MKSKTCGELYRQVVKEVDGCGGDALSIGFLVGQAEKVFIGACDGCMTKDATIETAAVRIASVYGLNTIVLRAGIAQVYSDELWLYRGTLKFVQFAIDSPEWNLHRAALCGVPASEIVLD